jgi:3',5'-cyclic AMP phosphodiesterase CpdA
MRTVVHISDLHFGHNDPKLPGPLRAAIESIKPDVTCISGDLTQRARRSQFREAAAFLETLPEPRIVVPGNHDVPLYDVVRRFAAPLDRFREFIDADEFPTYIDDEIAVVGVNTARSLTFKRGRINAGQVAEVERRFRGLPDAVTRIVVSHHPFDLAEGMHDRELVGRAAMAMQVFAAAGVDLFLSGHMHVTHAMDTAKRYDIAGYAALMIQAGTTTSTRGRGEANAFNVLRIGPDALTLQTWRWEPTQAAFTGAEPQAYAYTKGKGWSAMAVAAAPVAPVPASARRA